MNCTKKLENAKLTFKARNIQTGPIHSEPDRNTVLMMMKESKIPQESGSLPHFFRELRFSLYTHKTPLLRILGKESLS